MAALFMDNDVPVQLAVLLAREGHDVMTARRAGRSTATDAEHLLRASHERRILVTHNQKDFELLHDAWFRWSSAWGIAVHHAGILAVPQPHRVPVVRMAKDIDRFFLSGVTFADQLYRRRIGGTRTGWERWRPSVGWRNA